MKENIFLKNGTLFATGYNRIVHGERGREKVQAKRYIREYEREKQKRRQIGVMVALWDGMMWEQCTDEFL